MTRSTIVAARSGLALLLGSAFASLSGCGGKADVPLFPVQGHVLLDKKPLPSAYVGLHPDAERGNRNTEAAPWGTVDAKGNYTLQTQGRPGAPAGAYKVTVLLPLDAVGPRPNRKYEKPDTTDLTIEVSESPAPGAFDLPLQR